MKVTPETLVVVGYSPVGLVFLGPPARQAAALGAADCLAVENPPGLPAAQDARREADVVGPPAMVGPGTVANRSEHHSHRSGHHSHLSEHHSHRSESDTDRSTSSSDADSAFSDRPADNIEEVGGEAFLEVLPTVEEDLLQLLLYQR